jgi:hypothetical protein
MKRLLCVLLCLALCSLLTGCPKGKDKPPSTAKVSGTVALDGKPMEGGEVNFNIAGHPPKSLPVKGGAFSGEVYIGKNTVDVVWYRDSKPNPMDPKLPPTPVNVVAPEFQGANSPFKPDIPEGGKTDLKFEVKSAPR